MIESLRSDEVREPTFEQFLFYTNQWIDENHTPSVYIKVIYDPICFLT